LGGVGGDDLIERIGGCLEVASGKMQVNCGRFQVGCGYDDLCEPKL